jgi:hypothetical protein
VVGIEYVFGYVLVDGEFAARVLGDALQAAGEHVGDEPLVADGLRWS